MPAITNGVASGENYDALVMLKILETASDLTFDKLTVATFSGLKDAKHLGRKLNTIFKSYGYEYVNGKVVKLEEGGDRKRSNTDLDGDGSNEGHQEAKTIKKLKKGKKAKDDVSIVNE